MFSVLLVCHRLLVCCRLFEMFFFSSLRFRTSLAINLCPSFTRDVCFLEMRLQICFVPLITAVNVALVVDPECRHAVVGFYMRGSHHFIFQSNGNMSRSVPGVTLANGQPIRNKTKNFCNKTKREYQKYLVVVLPMPRHFRFCFHLFPFLAFLSSLLLDIFRAS
jgi:hypothetical protein